MAAAGATLEYDRMKEVKEFDDSRIGVKGLVDSGLSTIPRFFVHPPDRLSTLSPSSFLSVDIPVISLAGINSSRRAEIVNEIRAAAGICGFFQVVNHGVSQKILGETTSAIKSFHEQPVEMKKQYYGRQERGSVGYATNLDLFRSKAANWGHTLQVWTGPNPPELDQIPAICRKEVMAWDENVKRLAETVMELLCEGLGVTPSKLKELKCLESRAMVGHYYPYCPQADLTMGFPPHTDPGVLTVLLQNEIGGLQVKHGEKWVEVKPLPGALVINIGDFLQILSNNEYMSGQHRVLANRVREPRISIAVLINVDKTENSDSYGPLEELLSPEKPALYRKFTIEEFENKFFTKEIADKPLIDFFKL
ncbi:PREDICTED: 1-aminocyclopropane-1-carboxylate oxidase homolog 4-like [Nelumbo nucifera]|uniref:Fe2OG dioxygenase domain-containing protein n=2 Tax=Nelumbo nucifera TaxID=4432 RepID=A0A823A0B6_NELNU|nr:PREDICTED: 1-aminocyclopropane-1-carboxylate oxidase homolog 4-like [Nelumbo nucifera]DAD48496.1 TPA_asm: hypothetical protein HUJ06_018433 [Nelumbo nucifera]